MPHPAIPEIRQALLTLSPSIRFVQGRDAIVNVLDQLRTIASELRGAASLTDERRGTWAAQIDALADLADTWTTAPVAGLFARGGAQFLEPTARILDALQALATEGDTDRRRTVVEAIKDDAEHLAPARKGTHAVTYAERYPNATLRQAYRRIHDEIDEWRGTERPVMAADLLDLL